MNIETEVLHAGYKPKNGEPRVLPIVQSTTYKYDSTEYVGQLFDLTAPGFFYTRLANPTVDAVEQKIAVLEGGVGAMCTSSGQSATFMALLNILEAGDHFISTNNIYGGTFNLFAHTFKKFGIECTFVDQDAPLAELQKELRPNTKVVFGETIANPALRVLDIEKFAALAHGHDIPLFVDNTFPTPFFCKPFQHGADIVIHSTSKYLDGHAISLGGAVVDGGKFNWDNGKFPGLSTPDETYHGIIYTETFKEAAFITKARVQLMRDLGCMMAPQNAFLLNEGTETLTVRMERHYKNALTVAKFLQQQPQVDTVLFPGLPDNPDAALVAKYLPEGCSGVISFSVKGGREAAAKLIDALEMISLEVHVADIRTSILHPATSTHRQMTDEQLTAAGITPGMVRLSVGIEHEDDILADLKRGFSAM